MILLDEMAVRFTTSGEAELMNAVSQINRGMLQLKTTMETASRTLVDQFGNVIRSSQAAAAATTANTAATEKMAAGASASGAKMQQFALSAVFALSAMANGSDTAFLKITKGIAVLGFAFGPVTGAITTFVAIAGEQLIGWFNRAAVAAAKTKEAAEKSFAALGRGQDLVATATQANRLRAGDRFAAIGPLDKGGELFGDEMRAGGVNALQKRVDAINAKIAALGAEPAFDAAQPQPFTTYRKNLSALNAALIVAQDNLAPMQKALAELDKLAHEQAKTDSFQAGPSARQKEAEEAAKRAIEIAKIRYERELALAKDNQSAQLRLVDQRLAYLKSKGTEGVVEYEHELSRRSGMVQQFADANQRIQDKALAEEKQAIQAAHAQAMAASKDDLGRRLALAEDHRDMIGEMYPEDVEWYRAAQMEMTAVLQEQLDARARAEKAAADAAERERDRVAAKKQSEADAYQQKVDAHAANIAGILSGALASVAEDGGGFRSLTNAVLKGMGDMLVTIGQKWVAASAIVQFLSRALVTFSGGNMLIGGLALIALGSTLAVASTNNNGGGGGGYSAPDSPRTYHGYASINPAAGRGPSMTGRTEFAPITPATTPLRSMTDGVTMPGARESITVNATIIGTNDPRAQREIGELIKKGRARGEIPG